MMISTMRCGGNAAPDCVLRPHQCKKMGFIDDARPLRASVAGLCPSIVAVLRGSGRDAFPTVLGSRLRLNSSKSSRYLQGWSLHALNPKLEHSCQLGCSPNPSPALSVAAGLLKWSRKGRTSWLLFPLQQGGLPITAQAKDNNAARQAVESHCSNQARLPELSQETTGLRSGDVGKAIVRAVLLSVAVASTACLAWAGVTDAVGTRTMLLPSVVQQSKDIITTFWPKATQVLGVFRDQGLLLSVLLGLSAFFSMAETSITTLWPWKVRELAEKETEGGVFQLLRQDVTRFLTTILIGTTVANIAATALVTDAATALFGEAGVSAATGVMTVVILLLTEITPKSIAVHNATDVARFVVRPVAWLSYVLYPVGRVVTSISMSMLKFLGLKSSGEPFVTEEELKLMLRGAELSGAIEEEEQDMIENVLEIKDTYVREVMTPLVDVVAIDAGATLMDFRKLWVTHQYSRVPVFERRVDNIVGVAFAMDMLDYVEQTELLQKLTVGRIAHRPAYFVPDSMSVWNLLREFRIRKVHMAIVLNEYGGSVGVVTLEDVVEEIVGEIFDENDSKEEIRRKTGYVVQRADGVYDVDANTSIEDLSEALDTKVPEEPYHYETVSGFVCEAFGYIPRTGESINVILQKEDLEEGSDHREGEADYQEDRRDKYQKYRLEILAGNARKVGSVRFERLESTESKDGETATKVVPRVLRRRRENQKALEEYKAAKDTGGWDVSWNANTDSGNQPVSEDEDTCVVVEDRPSTQYLIAESIDVDSVSESDSCVTNGVTVGTEDGDMDAMEKKKTCETGTKDIDIGTATTVETLHEKWEQHEKFIERRRLRRRKQTVEATFELEKQRNTDAREREPEIPRMMLRKRHDFDTQQEQSCNNNEA